MALKPPKVDLPPDLVEKTAAICLQDSVERAGLLCYLFSAIFGAYGLTSLDFIRRFDPTATLWLNVWPRLAFNSFPLLVLALYLRRSRSSQRTKFYVWVTAFSLIVHASAWIFVWPLSLKKSADILTYVHAANTYLFAFIYAVVAPPSQFLIPFTAILGTIFVVPLFAVAYLSGDRVIFSLIVNDSLFTLVSGIFVANMFNHLRARVAALELEREREASKFLGPVVSKAIFHNQSHRLESVKCKGFVASLDVRGSTDLQKQDRDKWLTFRKEYFAMVAEIVARRGGYTQKTVGDCHVINFGVMEYNADLSMIPELDAEERRAEDRRLQHASDAAFGCLEEILTRFNTLALRHYPEGLAPRLGAGIDKGMVERGVQGDAELLELDVNGDPVNCSNRLQEYAKAVADQFSPTSSLLVISPFASDYLSDLSPYRRLPTVANPIRNYQNQIKWVLIREFSRGARLGAVA